MAMIGANTIGSFMQSAAIGSAYIQDAAITNAKIGDAAINNAKIGDAQVSTLKVAGESVTITRTFSNDTVYYGSDGGQTIVMDATINLPHACNISCGG